jgi:hypothetical protein
MSTLREELNNFSQFVLGRVGGEEPEPSHLHSLMNEWMLAHPSDAEFEENVAAVNASIDDYFAGERGRPAGELSRELQAQLDASIE